jgi:hypothetical protein
VKEAMLAIAVIVIITVVLLISMDRVSSRQTTNGVVSQFQIYEGKTQELTNLRLEVVVYTHMMCSAL